MVDSRPRVLVVDRETEETKRLLAYLERERYETLWARDGEAGFNVLDSPSPPEALISEIRLHRINGMRLLELARSRRSDICAVMIATAAEIDLAIEAMRQGALDFQVKPLNLDKLALTLERGLAHQRLVWELSDLRYRFQEKEGFHGLIGISPGIRQLFETLEQVATTNAAVLIIGETGTGKDSIARAIHEASERRNAPFVKLSCGALAESLIETELFGHERGAFTGAVSPRAGRFELADGGTFFLDGVDELPLQTQGKFLRILEKREFEPLGSTVSRKVDIRIIAAARQDLGELVQKGKVREDLYYRLRVVQLPIPPLREQKEDIPPLVSHFL
ncbi:MAG TPA: sigma-54 dependent transcriptional regulator, partial [bacterium]|nr:sigma-54 dependent transcriptional regulator [bacterium]